MKINSIIFLFILIQINAFSKDQTRSFMVLNTQLQKNLPASNTSLSLVETESFLRNHSILTKDTDLKNELLKRKIIAVSLAVTLGVFGVHRLYLGTSTKIPIIYTLTLGGGFGVLMVADIVAIIASEDLEDYSSNPDIFMWAK